MTSVSFHPSAGFRETEGPSPNVKPSASYSDSLRSGCFRRRFASSNALKPLLGLARFHELFEMVEGSLTTLREFRGRKIPRGRAYRHERERQRRARNAWQSRRAKLRTKLVRALQERRPVPCVDDILNEQRRLLLTKFVARCRALIAEQRFYRECRGYPWEKCPGITESTHRGLIELCFDFSDDNDDDSDYSDSDSDGESKEDVESKGMVDEPPFFFL